MNMTLFGEAKRYSLESKEIQRGSEQLDSAIGTVKYFIPMANTGPRGDSHHQLAAFNIPFLIAEVGDDEGFFP